MANLSGVDGEPGTEAVIAFEASGARGAYHPDPQCWAGTDSGWRTELNLLHSVPEGTQFSSWMTTYMALAYWDADETPDGRSPAGHLQSFSGGWIEVALPAFPP